MQKTMIDANEILKRLELEYGMIYKWNDEYEDDYQFGIKKARDIVNDLIKEGRA